jgi:hypothetical protein
MDQESMNKLVRLARIPRLYRLLRILRLFKLIRVFKYSKTIQNMMSYLKINAGISRMLQVTASVILMVHLMTCFWFLAAKMDNFSENTWVS